MKVYLHLLIEGWGKVKYNRQQIVLVPAEQRLALWM
jgi:hypothetical protein